MMKHALPENLPEAARLRKNNTMDDIVITVIDLAVGKICTEVKHVPATHFAMTSPW